MVSAAALFLGVGFAAIGATSAQADPGQPEGTCGGVYNPSIGAGKAHWELHCKNGAITVSGHVTDTRSDGQCVKVKAVFEGQTTEYSAAACPKDTTRNFSWTHPGSIADVYLFAYHA
ncbi:hypothetical protein BJY24_001412 [Nocardia transvalensis]|uniref:Secreted protein n=1 Tax=Nocardia transvalensis TaxID=37333 RepID=A0A7W9PAP4_9NOCA|nr:hypothetical protein [Nocardia transvalensis]MBB5912545.1 hypothetical protein [Nocardia transvalensis]